MVFKNLCILGLWTKVAISSAGFNGTEKSQAWSSDGGQTSEPACAWKPKEDQRLSSANGMS